MATVHPPVDVVTVGAGWTAGILAWKLTEAGRSVVSLEQGPGRWANPDFAWNHDGLRYAQRKAMMNKLNLESWTWRPDARSPSLPMRRYGSFHPGEGLGGAAAHWSAMLWRLTPYDFAYRTWYEERYGAQKLPEGSSVQDWPVSYEELEPYYDAFEYDIGTSGQAGNLRGELQPGGNPFEGPRSRPFPLPPLESTLPSYIFADAARRQGYHPFPQPAGILSEAYTDPWGRTRSGCLYCGFCTRFGCEVDAKASGITTHTPLALQTGRYQVRTHAKATRVETASDGRATGVTYVDLLTGEEHFQPAEVVILSAYTLSNVRLMMLSRSNAHPEGIGNGQGQLGRNCTYQIWEDAVTGVFNGRRFNLFAGNTATIQVLHDFYGNALDHGDLDFIGGSAAFSTVGEREPVTSVGSLPVGDGPRWGRQWKETLRTQWDSFVPITLQGESPAYEGHFYDLDPNYRDAFGQPLLRFTFDYTENEKRLYNYVTRHMEELMGEMGADTVDVQDELPDYNLHEYKSTHMTGGAIMGSDPGNSVTNKYGQVWDAPNLFVTGAALFPQNGASNPTGTLAALAYMTGDALAQRYFRNPMELLV